MTKPIIGSIEQVQIASHGDMLVPSKIDTGAESSSIWATQVEQNEGELTYTLFGPGSAYYTGIPHTAKRFKITTVKNSFGYSETRYKVLLKIKIGEHTIRGWFTLADRSRNNYPILLGKSLLKDQFLVDVSQNHIHGENVAPRVLVVSASKKTADFLEKVQERSAHDIEYATVRFEDVLFVINGELSDAINTLNGESLSNYALTYIKSHWNYPEPASALAELLKFKNRPVVDEEVLHYTSRSKLSEMMKLSVYGLPVPRSYIGYKATLARQGEIITKELGFPLIMKSVTADKGKDNFFVKDYDVYVSVLEAMTDTDIYAVQEYISNDGFYRLNVFGKDVTLAVYRSAYPHDNPLKQHLNKPSGGMNAELVPLGALPAQAVEIAVRAAMCMERQIAGADVVQNKETDEWFVLEVNSSPQIRTGAYLEEKINEFARFIEERLAK